MVKPNYAFAKRQRDLAKKAKRDEKRSRKGGQGPLDSPDAAAPSAQDAPSAVQTTPTDPIPQS